MKPPHITILRILRAGGLVVALLTVCVVALVLPLAFAGGTELKFPPTTWSLAPFVRLATDWRAAIGRTLLLAAVVATISATIAVASAYFARRMGRARLWMSSIAILPMFIPPITLALGYLFFFTRLGWFDSLTALAIAEVILVVPLSFLIAMIALNQTDAMLEDVAVSFGASRWHAFVQVTLPDMRGALGAAWILAFVATLDEPVMSVFLADAHARTVAREIWDGLRYSLDPAAAAAAATFVVVAVFAGIVAFRAASLDR